MKAFDIFRAPMIILMVIAISLINTSCDKDPVEDKPVLPPVSSFIMDFSDFDQLPAGAKSTIPSFQNFSHAFGNVAFWHRITTITLALPVAAYAQILNQEPEYMGDNTWEWTYDFSMLNVEYKATLTAERLNNEEFKAEMSINKKTLPGKGQTWFDGVVRYDHTHASWNLYKYENITQVKILESDWNWDYETETGDMTYTYVESGNLQEGSFIKLELFSPDQQELDAAFTISLSAGVIYIEWNRTTKAGRIMDPNHFQDELWHCWDETLVDVDCNLK